MPYVRPFFSWYGTVLWLALVTGALVLAGLHWGELTMDITDRVLAPQNLLIIWFTFPVLKAFHEFGHAFAVKRWGGEVHEMGVMLLVLMPVPYVDASAATAFRDKYPRVIVGSAGMLVEMAIAALAMFLWVNVEPGMVRAVAYNVILIAGVSTLLFNINPLLRFDGYYIFGDLIEIPNLRTRANRYFTYLTERFLLGLKESPEPEGSPGEKRWFLLFAVSSFIYRMFVTFAIVMLIAGQYFVFGVILAIFCVIGAIVLPLAKGFGYLFLNTRLRRNRVRAVGAVGAVIAVLVREFSSCRPRCGREPKASSGSRSRPSCVQARKASLRACSSRPTRKSARATRSSGSKNRCSPPSSVCSARRFRSTRCSTRPSGSTSAFAPRSRWKACARRRETWTAPSSARMRWTSRPRWTAAW